MLASFDGVDVKEVPGRPMSLDRRGSALWATLDDPDSNAGDSRPRVTRQVVMTTGSHRQQIYWYATGRGRLLGQLPAEYLVEERRWIPRSAVLMHPPTSPFSETGSWNSTCIACHTTLGQPRLMTPAAAPPSRMQVGDTQSVEFGIACESGHGPGAEHVRLNRNPLRRYGLRLTRTRDESTVLPDQLAAHRSSEVCGQCHSVWEFFNEAGERQANAAGLPYRPGDQLATTRMVVQPTHAGGFAGNECHDRERSAIHPRLVLADGMIRVSGREYNASSNRRASETLERLTEDVVLLLSFDAQI
jgi:hypothetical protein